MAKTNKKKTQKKTEYSKVLLTQESILIWITTLGMMGIALMCILKGYTGSLPWLAAMVAFPWTAYGVSQAFYYKKSEKENTKDGIKYESVMAEVKATYGEAIKKSQIDWNPSPTTTVIQTTSQQQTSSNIDLDYGI